jgi:putative Ca2+/H+ antiporter (TMEM165/GDT1 family)
MHAATGGSVLPSQRMSLTLFGTVFGIIFIAELPDKTALAALVLATRHKALPVFLGTALALSVQSAVAVLAGSLFGRLDPRYVHIGSGAVFIVFAAMMWFRKEEPKEAEDKEPTGFWRAFATTFGVIFIAEWGDLTQLGTAALEARYHAWVTVLLASIAALWCVAALAVFVGNRAGRLLDPHITQKIAAVIFLIVGVVLLAQAL